MNRSDTVMNRKIFRMDLSMEAVSLYLLCCGLSDSADSITGESVRTLWNGTEPLLETAFSELEERRILVKSDDGPSAFHLTDSGSWLEKD